jgi:hypothetical protein
MQAVWYERQGPAHEVLSVGTLCPTPNRVPARSGSDSGTPV